LQLNYWLAAITTVVAAAADDDDDYGGEEYHNEDAHNTTHVSAATTPAVESLVLLLHAALSGQKQHNCLLPGGWRHQGRHPVTAVEAAAAAGNSH
jgi:hypothetical protein